MSVTNAVESQLCVDTRGFLSNSDDEEMVTETSVCAQDVTLQEFYDVVMVLRNAIKGAKKLDSSWPPTSADSSEGQMLKMAPVQMF